MALRRTEDLHNVRQQAVGAGAHVDGVGGQPHGVDADHRSSSRIQTAQSLVAPAGQVTVTVNPLPTLTVNDTICAPNLLTYSVLVTTNGNTVTATLGMVANNGGGDFVPALQWNFGLKRTANG